MCWRGYQDKLNSFFEFISGRYIWPFSYRRYAQEEEKIQRGQMMVDFDNSGIRIADDDIYLKEDRRDQPKEMFKFIR